MPKHDKKKYVDENGTLFWPGGHPLYLYVTDNSEAKNIHQLKSKKTPEYTNPMYLDTEGANWIRSKWAYKDSKYSTPKQEVEFAIYRDSNPPKTNVELNDATRYENNNSYYFGKGLKISITSQDALSGVENIMISQDGQPFMPYAGPISADAEKKYSFKIYAIDNVGNVSEMQHIKFQVDFTPPKTTHVIKGEKYKEILSSTTIISLHSKDDISKVKQIRYSFDGAAEQQFTDEIRLNNLEEGNHTLTYYSIDNVNNKEEEKRYNFYLDKTPPSIEASVVGDQYQNRGRVFVSTRSKVKLEAEDEKSGVRSISYRIDGGDEIDFVEPFDLPKDEGKHVINFYAVDNVGNDTEEMFDESKHGRTGLDLDMSAPELSYSVGEPKIETRDTLFVTSKSPVVLQATDNDAGINKIGYKVDNKTGKTYESPITIENEGYHRIDYYATDNVNNRGIDEFFLVVDNTGPTIETVLSNEPIGHIELETEDQKLPVYAKNVKLYLGATDKTVDTGTLYYKINDGSYQEYGNAVSLSQTGVITFQIKAVDKLGNATESEPRKIFVQ